MFTPDKSIVLQYSFIIHIALYIMLHIVTSHKNKIVALNTGFLLVPSLLITMGPPPIINITGKISIVIIAKRTVCIILITFIHKDTNNYLINNYSEGFFFNNFFLIIFFHNKKYSRTWDNTDFTPYSFYKLEDRVSNLCGYMLY